MGTTLEPKQNATTGSTTAAAAAPGPWVSWAAAAPLIGCSQKLVQRAAANGQIKRRPGSRPRGRASLEIESVLTYATVWRAQQAARKTGQAAREADAATRSRTPPDEDQVWLSSSQVAAVLEVSVGRVGQLTHAGALRSTLKGNKRWFPRRHVEQFAARRALPGWRPPPHGGYWSTPDPPTHL